MLMAAWNLAIREKLSISTISFCSFCSFGSFLFVPGPAWAARFAFKLLSSAHSKQLNKSRRIVLLSALLTMLCLPVWLTPWGLAVVVMNQSDDDIDFWLKAGKGLHWAYRAYWARWATLSLCFVPDPLTFFTLDMSSLFGLRSQGLSRFVQVCRRSVVTSCSTCPFWPSNLWRSLVLEQRMWRCTKGPRGDHGCIIWLICSHISDLHMFAWCRSACDHISTVMYWPSVMSCNLMWLNVIRRDSGLR